jgi:hypothetical protein
LLCRGKCAPPSLHPKSQQRTQFDLRRLRTIDPSEPGPRVAK